jgi:hypothetical protein
MPFYTPAKRLSTVLLACALGLGLSVSAVTSAPRIRVTDLPPYGSTQPLRGTVRNIDPTTVKLATYVFKEGLGWYVKPTLASPCTGIEPDGQWEVNVTTGFCDRWATKYALYLVPAAESCPLASGTPVPPPGLEASALTSIRVDRNPFLDTPLEFAGRFWVIKDSGHDTCKVGPGLNIFAPQNVRVDEDGLHLTITEDNGVWRTAEVWLNESLGFGEYRALMQPLPNDLDPQAVFGAFTWDQEAPPSFRELDFELSRFGKPTDPTNAQFAVQPENLFRFTIPLADLQAGMTFTQLWLPGQVTFALYRGQHRGTLSESDLMTRWTKTGAAIPKPGSENFRLNLWLFQGRAPRSGQPQEVGVSHFDLTAFRQYVDVASLPDMNGNNTTEIATLLVELGSASDGQTAHRTLVIIKDTDTSRTIDQLEFFTTGVQPLALARVADLDAGGHPGDELAVLAVVAGKPRVEIRDVASHTVVATATFFNANWTPIGLATVPDQNGNGGEDIAVLAQHKITGAVRVIVKDPLTGEQLDVLSFPK